MDSEGVPYSLNPGVTMVELKFAFYGRICAIVYVLAAVIISTWQLFTFYKQSSSLGAYTIVAGIFVGLIELPVCCSCFAWCKILAKILRVVTGYWAVRAVIFGGMSVFVTRFCLHVTRLASSFLLCRRSLGGRVRHLPASPTGGERRSPLRPNSCSVDIASLLYCRSEV